MQHSPQQKSWWHKRHVVLGLSVLLGLVMVVFVQLLYPVGRALPLVTIGSSKVGGQTFEQVIERVRGEYANVPLTIQLPNKPSFKTTTAEAGIVPGYRHAAEAVTEYSLTARLVPFSFVYKMLQRPEVGYEIDELNYKAFRDKLIAHCHVAPKDAALVFEKGSARLDRARAGQKCEPQAVRTMVSEVSLRAGGVTTAMRPVTVAPKRPDSEVQQQLASAEATIKAGLTIRTSKDAWPVPAETVATWLTTEEVDSKVVLAIKPEVIKAYLESLKGILYIEPGVTTVSFHDGIEVARAIGKDGQGIDVEVTTERIKTVLLGSPSASRTAWVQLTVLKPKVASTWTYSASERGIQALIEQWERDNPARYGIMVRDLSGKGLNAEFNGDRDFITASTYKMFLAYAVMHKIEQGELSFDARTDMGLNVRACIDEMILHSTNACATSLMNLAGWSYVHNFIKGQFPATSLDNGTNADNEKHTTVRDETNFLIRLNAGQLMTADNTNYLLGLMKRQVYRSGIPRGVPGVTVANKVGFYDGWKHDVGIIYAGRGTYALSVLSLGGNDGQFADLSRRVSELLGR